MSSKTVKLGGTYRHHKGKMYKVHQLVRHSETLEELVVYECLYDSPAGQWWVRPLAMFTETVIVEGVEKPRFELVSE